jgi:hypothetical protein
MTEEHGGEDVSRRVTPGPADSGLDEELRQVLEKASKGDESALPELRRLLDDSPALWRRAGDLARHALEALIGLAAGESLVLRESILRQVAELKADLAPAGRLERLLVERVAACWVATYHADTVFGQAHDLTPPREAQLRRRQDSANRRFLGSLKLLEIIRRLLGAKARGRPSAAWRKASPEERAAFVAAHADELAPLLADAPRQRRRHRVG